MIERILNLITGKRYWVHSLARDTNHESKVGPFLTHWEATMWALQNRAFEDWETVINTDGRDWGHFDRWLSWEEGRQRLGGKR